MKIDTHHPLRISRTPISLVTNNSVGEAYCEVNEDTFFFPQPYYWGNAVSNKQESIVI